MGPLLLAISSNSHIARQAILYSTPDPQNYKTTRPLSQELGIHQSVSDLTSTINQQQQQQQQQTSKSTTKPRKRKQYFIDMPVRRSGRLQGADPETLDEDEIFRKMGIDRLDLVVPSRRRKVNVDPTQLSSIRAKRVSTIDGKSTDKDGSNPPSISVYDSGLGVRIQGGRVYDSKYGETCHWCRQKTLEEHVQCTNENCGGGNRLPVAFCRMCLRNRHGEDIKQAIASECWICPACRGNCGDGCVSCCNCGPCRKKAGLGPTHQLIKQARAAGFTNVHDYLVHKSTGETADAITARKTTFPWGQWLLKPFTPPSEEEEEEEEKDAPVTERSSTIEPAATPSAEEAPAHQQASEEGHSDTETEDEEDRSNILNRLCARIIRATTVDAGKKNVESRKDRILRKLGLKTARA